jgi:hypothetical protein
MASQSINFPSLGSKIYSNGLTIGLGATASSGLVVSYSSPDTNLVNISGTNVTVLGAGTMTIVASQGGDTNYLAATPVTNTLVITPASVTRTQTIALNAGCTWVSFNVATTDGSWTGMLSGDTASDSDAILGSGGSLTYQSGKWYPSDTSFRPTIGAMYMVMSSSARNLTVQGTTPAVAIPFALSKGWNWIGSLRTTNTSLDAMIPGLQLSEGDIIVDQLGGMATYYQGAWYSNTGGVFVIRPGIGYQIYLKNAQNVLLY